MHTPSRRLSRSLGLTLGAALLLAASACSDSDVTPNNSPGQPLTCPPGQSYNPILGECVGASPQDMGSSPRDMASPRDMTTPVPDMAAPDMSTRPDMPLPPLDMNPDTRCSPGIDSDGDGLNNDCECAYGTDPFNPDTDGDGLTDGQEDADKSCSLTRGSQETDARNADTDGDGLNDGLELQIGTHPLRSDTDGDGINDKIEHETCTDPLNVDSDGDGLEDGVEDANFDGQLGTCVNRVYDVMCAMGESDPCKADTDGDGVPDAEEVQYRRCREEDKLNLVQPALILSVPGDYQLALQPTATHAPVTSMSQPALKAHVFEEPVHHYTGFILNMPAPNAAQDPAALADYIFSQVSAIPDYAASTRRSAGRRVTTHDGFNASVDTTVDLPAGTPPEQARDRLLARLTGLSDLTHPLASAIAPDAAQPTLLHYQIISRSASEVILVAAFVPFSKGEDPARSTGWRVDDLIGGTSVARATETLEADCVSYKVITRPKVDIIISADASGSISDERAQLSGFATSLVQLLNGANLDWRVGVTSVACSGIASDNAFPADFKALFPGGGGVFNPGGVCVGFGAPGGGTTNGALIGGNFTQDPVQIKNRIDNANSTASEYTATMNVAAAVRALPRTTSNAPDKLRDGAALILISVTDEEEELFKSTLRFLPKELLSPAERVQLDMATQPWIDYMLRPELGATLFGLYYVPGDPCSTAQPASAIHDLVVKTGGSGGSICQADITTTLQTIASATAGIASGLRLRGSPVSPSIKVLRGEALTGVIGPMTRSRADGFDFDGVVNRIAFYGPNPPQTNDVVVIPYLRWKDSLRACRSSKDCPQEQKLQCVQGICL